MYSSHFVRSILYSYRMAYKAKLNARTAVLLIDVLNDLEFPGGEKVLPWAVRLAPPLRLFCTKARRAGFPVIYVNDMFGDWHADRTSILAHCTRRTARGRKTSHTLRPQKSDFFILKPQHSAFFCTPLLPLLQELSVRQLVLAGIATNLCVLITAHDAHMHHFPIVVLSDCCAAESDFDHNVVLTQLQTFFGAQICRSTEVHIPAPHRSNLAKQSRSGSSRKSPASRA
jgi:nicotinamidase-related amidase